MKILGPNTTELFVTRRGGVVVIIREFPFEKIHPTLIKGVVDLKDHSFQCQALVVEIPERNRVEDVSQAPRRSDQICMCILFWIFTLPKV